MIDLAWSHVIHHPHSDEEDEDPSCGQGTSVEWSSFRWDRKSRVPYMQHCNARHSKLSCHGIRTVSYMSVCSSFDSLLQPGLSYNPQV